MNRYRIYTGPTLTYEVADRLRKNFTLVSIGTYFVYVDTEKSIDEVLTALGSGWTWRDVCHINRWHR